MRVKADATGMVELKDLRMENGELKRLDSLFGTIRIIPDAGECAVMKKCLATVMISLGTSLCVSFAATATSLTFDFMFTVTSGTVMGKISGLQDNTSN